jgi:hypothetical protein
MFLMKDISSAIEITREKHLDHMVKVVPFIVFCYAVQSYIILSISPGEFSTIGLSILGSFLALMIAGFITYDLNHKVKLSENFLTISFFWLQKEIHYQDILEIDIQEPDQSFSAVTLITTAGKTRIYFCDDAVKIKTYIESKKTPELLAA